MNREVQVRVVTRCALLGILLVVGCHDALDCCVDTATGALVEGFVVDQLTQPEGGARVGTTGLRRSCGQANPMGPAEGGAVADARGWFRMGLGSFLGSPGKFCVDLVVSRDGLQPDTIRDIEMEFFDGAVRDTARVVLRVSR